MFFFFKKRERIKKLKKKFMLSSIWIVKVSKIIKILRFYIMQKFHHLTLHIINLNLFLAKWDTNMMLELLHFRSQCPFFYALSTFLCFNFLCLVLFMFWVLNLLFLRFESPCSLLVFFEFRLPLFLCFKPYTHFFFCLQSPYIFIPYMLWIRNPYTLWWYKNIQLLILLNKN